MAGLAVVGDGGVRVGEFAVCVRGLRFLRESEVGDGPHEHAERRHAGEEQLGAADAVESPEVSASAREAVGAVAADGSRHGPTLWEWYDTGRSEPPHRPKA